MINRDQISAIREIAGHLEDFQNHREDLLISMNQLLFVMHQIEDYNIDRPTEEGGTYYNKEGIIEMMQRLSDLMSVTHQFKEILPTLHEAEELQYNYPKEV